MALATGWTILEVMAHSPRQLRAMADAMQAQARARRMRSHRAK